MHNQYEGEYLHALAIAVTSMPDRCLSFQLVFTGCESDVDDSQNVHGGAMWARMPITALVGDIALARVARADAYSFGSTLGLPFASSYGD
jgi:hypothetical protein